MPRTLRGTATHCALVAAMIAALGAQCDSTQPSDTAPAVLWEHASFVKTDRAVVTPNAVVVGTRDGGSLVSLSRSTGTPIWERPLNGPNLFFERQVVRADDLVFAAPIDLFAVDVTTGQTRWTMRSAGAHLTRTPVIVDGALYVGNAYGEVLRLDPGTGDTVWRTDLVESVFGVTVSGDRVLLGTRAFADTAARDGPLGTGRVVALSTGDGAVVWSTPVGDPPGFPGSGGIVAAPLVVNGIVVVGTQSSRVVGLRFADGAIVWQQGDASPVSSQYGDGATVGVLGGQTILFRNVGLVESFDPQTGTLLWQAGAPRESASELAAPVIADGKIYAVLAGNVWVFDDDGTVLWRYGKRADGDGLPVYTSGPTVAEDGTVFLGGYRESPGFPSFFTAIRPPELN